MPVSKSRTTKYLESSWHLFTKLTSAIICLPEPNSQENILSDLAVVPRKVIKIKIYHSIKDTYINPDETKELSQLLNNYDIKHSYEPLIIEDQKGHAFHHRIYEKLVKDLF